MSLLKLLETMLEKRITYQKRKNTTHVYVYYAVKAYRNKKGQPTPEIVCIGQNFAELGLDLSSC